MFRAMKIVVDYDSCESNGKCMEAAPEIFKLHDDDTLEVLNENPDRSGASGWSGRCASAPATRLG